MKTIELKIGNMRKPQRFIVYPPSRTNDNNVLQIQSEDCIARVYINSRVCEWARNPGGAYFIHLNMPSLAKKSGTQVLEDSVVEALQNIQPKPGDKVANGVVIIG